MYYYYPNFNYLLCSNLYSTRFYNVPVNVYSSDTKYPYATCRGEFYNFEILDNGTYKIVCTAVIFSTFDLLIEYISNYSYIKKSLFK